jgi:hypothetical protein
MDFLFEPMELGTEYEQLLDPTLQTVACDTGYVCATGKISPDK